MKERERKREREGQWSLGATWVSELLRNLIILLNVEALMITMLDEWERERRFKEEGRREEEN